jgi:ribosome maturation factor RimP
MNKLTPIVKENLSSGMVLMDIQEDVRGSFLRIIVDAEEPITLDDTTNLSKRLRNSDHFESLFPTGFRLEVTTPGVDKSLEHPFQYRKNLNRELTVEFFDGDELNKTAGKIINADDEKVILNNDGIDIEFSYDLIQSAKVSLSFKK